MIKLDSKVPEGPMAEKWTRHKFNVKLVNPSNRRKYKVIVVGTGLAGCAVIAGGTFWLCEFSHHAGAMVSIPLVCQCWPAILRIWLGDTDTGNRVSCHLSGPAT